MALQAVVPPGVRRPQAVSGGATMATEAIVSQPCRMRYDWRSNVEIFGLTVATRSPWPWLMSITLAGSGAALCRFTYRRVGQAWRTANAIVTEQTSKI